MKTRFHLDGARHIFDEETLTFVSFKVKSYDNLLLLLLSLLLSLLLLLLLLKQNSYS